jgi:hypothetical protein
MIMIKNDDFKDLRFFKGLNLVILSQNTHV